MPGFFFRPVDLSSLAFLFVAVLVGWRLLTLQPRTTRSRWLSVFFAASALLALFSIAASARLDAWRFYAIHLQIVTSALGIAALLQYVYRVGDFDPHDKESRAVLALSLAALLYVSGWAVYQFLQLSPLGRPTTNTTISEGLIGLGLLWTLLVAVRQLRHAARGASQLPTANHLVILVVGVLLLLAANSFQFVGGLIPGFAPKPIYTIYVIALGVIAIGFNYFLHWDSANTRVNRVIAAALVLLQSVFAVLAIIYGSQLDAQPHPPSFLGQAAYRLFPKETRGYRLDAAAPDFPEIEGQPIQGDEFLIQSDFPLLFFDRQYSNLLVSRGRLLFGDEWSAQKANFFLQPHIYVIDLSGQIEESLTAEFAQSSHHLTVRWSLPEGPLAQVTIDAKGLLQFDYLGPAAQPLQRWGLSAGQGMQGARFLLAYPPPVGDPIPAAGILFESNFTARIGLDQWTRPILFFQLLVSLFIIPILSAVRGRLRFLDHQLLAQTLKKRQLEIAQLVAAGKSNAEIGAELNITENTVKYHLKQIYQSLNLENRAELRDWYRQKH